MRKIVICTKCDGTGTYNHVPDFHDYQEGEDDFDSGVCPKCKGSGRCVDETTTTTEPYVPETK